jgi:signal transduction histidine kinase
VIAVCRSVWREPRPADPPPVGPVDWLVAGGFAAAALVEAMARPDLGLRPLVTALALGLAPALLRRRHHPLTTCLIGFGVAGLLSILQLATRAGDLGLTAMTAILVLLYSLVRWGSGREVALGMPFVAAVVALGMVTATATASAGSGDVVGGILFVLLVIALAAAARYRADLWARQQREIRNDERLALARELHDTVAHHVSAIAVQAQAGGVVALAKPARAAEILASIESEAARTLAEMRDMVRVLRDETWDAYSPQLGVADLPALARTTPPPVVEVSVPDPALWLSPAVDATVYRIAQEALTNSLRHARGATRVGIEVCLVGDFVRLRVADDGEIHPGQGASPGFGLTGMTERAALLGGALTAGPGAGSGGGWVVDATLPAGGPR